MRDDPIIQEVRRAREELFGECDFDLDKLFARVKGMAKQDDRKRVSFPPKRITPSSAPPGN